MRANTVTNVRASADTWDLRVDAGCGVAGCDPRLTRDGDDNNVAASRWSCTGDCILELEFDDEYRVSYIVICEFVTPRSSVSYGLSPN